MIFHRHLKVSELDYDDEKDLDTSLSGESAKDFFKSPPGLIQIPSVDKNNTSSSTSSNLTFDNDLAALLSGQDGQCISICLVTHPKYLQFAYMNVVCCYSLARIALCLVIHSCAYFTGWLHGWLLDRLICCLVSEFVDQFTCGLTG